MTTSIKNHPDMTNGGHDTTTKVTGRAATMGACPFRRAGGPSRSHVNLLIETKR